MGTIRPEITGRATGDGSPLAVTVQRACELSGLGQTSIWHCLKTGRLKAVHVPGLRRTLVSYPSLVRLLSPPSDVRPEPQPRRRGRPRKSSDEEVTP
jgi:hypothetical protein